MSQFITVQVGQCGNQIGSAFWPMVLQEYGIEESHRKSSSNTKIRSNEYCDAFHSLFHVPNSCCDTNFQTFSDVSSAKVKARAVLIDMEDSVVARFKTGPLRSMFNQNCTVTNYPGSANNWGRGFYTHGIEFHDKIEETIRSAAEKCDSLHGFLIMHSLGGGTGSGLGTSTLKLLDENYPHVDRFVSSIYPMSTQDVVTAPYNVLLATRQLIEHATCVFPAENQALQNICNTFTNRKKEFNNQSFDSFQDMNSIIVNQLLHLTSGSRFPGPLNIDMNDLATNLIAFPKLHYIFSSVDPVSMSSASTTLGSNSARNKDELFTNVWSRSSQLININPLQPKASIIGSAHIARGSWSVTDVRRNIERFRNIPKSLPWSSEANKVGLCSVPPINHNSSLLCLINSTAMSFLFKDVVRRFDVLFKKKAHIHHYLEVDNFEIEDFVESRREVLNVYERYTEVQNQTPNNVTRLQLC